jgi:transmembrane sensor
MQSHERFSGLLDKYISGIISQAEQNELFLLIATGEYDHLLEDHFHASFHHAIIPGADMPSQRAQDIKQKILHAEKHTAHLLPGIFRKKKTMVWYMAAAITGLLGLAAWMLLIKDKSGKSAATAQTAISLAEQRNNSAHAQQLKLEDGTVITLQPHSALRFPRHFDGDKREVYLDGEAFFEVKRNPDRPFFVYYNNLVTQVLGTSFDIKTDSLKKEVEVSVVTGKVQVYEKNDKPVTNHSRTNGVILTPNQKVIYKEDVRQFTATLVNEPLPVKKETTKSSAPTLSFNFEESRLIEVFGVLEKTYGIEIVVDNDRIYNCLFTGNITQHGLFSKLTIICESVNAGYQVVGTRILVTGKGCN